MREGVFTAGGLEEGVCLRGLRHAGELMALEAVITKNFRGAEASVGVCCQCHCPSAR